LQTGCNAQTPLGSSCCESTDGFEASNFKAKAKASRPRTKRQGQAIGFRGQGHYVSKLPKYRNFILRFNSQLNFIQTETNDKNAQRSMVSMFQCMNHTEYQNFKTFKFTIV